MALPDGGSQLALTDAGNGKLTVQWVNGNPLFDDSMDETIFSLLLEPAGYFGDRTNKRRSLISTVKERDASTPGKLVQYARDALQPAIDAGLIQSVSPTVQTTAVGYVLVIAYVNATGKPASVSVPVTV